MFPNSTITHLSVSHLDHRPLLLHPNRPSHNLARPFKFESMGTLHPDTGIVIQHAWQLKEPFVSKLKDTKLALKDWNKMYSGMFSLRSSNLENSLMIYLLLIHVWMWIKSRLACFWSWISSYNTRSSYGETSQRQNGWR